MKVLLYNLENNIILKNTLTMMNIECIFVNKKDYEKPLSNLLGLNSIVTSNNNTDFDDEMLIMYDFSDEQLDALLALLKINNIKIALKAIVTETNINWNSLQIHNELIKEHLYLNKRSS